MQHKLSVPSALAIGGAMVWGVIEFAALCRSRWTARRQATPQH